MPRRAARGIAGLALLVGLALGAAHLPAAAAGGPPATGPHVTARLLSAVGGTGDLATVPAGLAIDLEGDWKTYWRSPGDAGLPPALDWQGSRNLASATLLYPAPQRITVLGIQTFGYKHHVVLPLDIRPAEKGKPLDLKLALDLLVCAEQCVPETLHLALAVPSGPSTPDADAQTIAMARAAVPTDTRASGLAIAGAEEVADDGAPAFQVAITSEQALAAPDLVAELTPDVAFAAPRTIVSPDRHAATFVLPLARKLPIGASLAGRKAVVTVTDKGRALEQTVTVARGASAARETPGPSLLAALGIALLGGLILNLMPCVLPVLSLKLVGLVGQGGRAPGAIRAGFLATACGIVVSFAALALALIALKAAGRTIGWGIQFQEPGFIAALAVLVTLFACQLAGLFEIPLPRWIANAFGRRGPGENLAGHFLTGAFATLLATPCSAPFLGTAVAFALAGGTGQLLAIFLALGLGLALPYLLVAAVPSLAARLPRPGRWMLRLKQLLAVPLALTALWLLAILASQVGIGAAALATGLLLAMTLLLAVRPRLPRAPRRLAVPATIVLALATIVLPDVIAAEIGKSGRADDDGIAWQAFDRDKARSLVAQGRTVFVDVTADWCLTCQANKKFVLARPALAKRLDTEAMAMQADWTRPDAAIAAFLASYGRYGIPFNIVYGPGAPGGIVLPELLTAEDVGAALDTAARRTRAERAGAAAAPVAVVGDAR